MSAQYSIFFLALCISFVFDFDPLETYFYRLAFWLELQGLEKHSALNICKASLESLNSGSVDLLEDLLGYGIVENCFS